MNIQPSQATLDKNIELLREIGRHLGKRVLSCNISDPQVQRSKWDWKDSLSDKPIPSDVFSRELKYSFSKYKVTLRVNDEFLSADVRGDFGNSLICSFNRPKIYGGEILAPAILCDNYLLPVYESPNSASKDYLMMLQNPKVQKLVLELRLSGKESFHVYEGGATLYLQRSSLSETLNILSIAFKLLDLIPEKKQRITFTDLPEEFQVLIPWIQSWGILDDDDRYEKVKHTSSKRLADLCESVEPHYKAINQYLNTFGKKPLPESAIFLGALAECSSEARIALEKRARPRLPPGGKSPG